MKKALLILATFLAMGCESQSQVAPTQSKMDHEAFNQYWYGGLAELSSYDLKQSRYGSIHEGEAVLIFVTEDFSRSKQVKLDYASKDPSDVAKVMKLNFAKKFNTGIYPYTILTSVFSPMDLGENHHSLKTSTSVQEWCGHTFSQLNLRKDYYAGTLHSYFESEGEQQLKLKKTWLEDEIWNLIRIDPSRLPVGKIEMIPSSFTVRLKHMDWASTEAQVSLDESADDFSLYNMTYAAMNQHVVIKFSKAFPHQILGWTETTNERGRTLTTEATLKKSIQLDYWNRHNPSDLPLRDTLQLR